MNAKIILSSALAALLMPAFAAGQTDGPRAVRVPVVSRTAEAQMLPLTGDMRSDLAVIAASQDERPAAQTVLQEQSRKKPIAAGLMSLAVPGAGQVYAGSYTRAAIYVAAEVAGIAWAILYNNKGDRRTDEFQGYADAHWSAVRYAQFLNHYAWQYRQYKDSAHIDVTLPRDAMWDQINAYENGSWERGFSHRLPRYGEQQYYELIGKYDQFKYGWDEYPHAGDIPADDHGDYASVPQQLKNYAATRGSANDFYASSRLAISLVVINHVVSAVDAYLAARHYNVGLSSSMSMQRVGERLEIMPKVSLAIGL